MKRCRILNCTESELLNGPDDGTVKFTLVLDWDKMKEGEINMNENGFELILGSNGQVGIKGAGRLLSHEAIDEFIAKIKEQLEIAYDAQIRRGTIPQA